MGALRIYMHVVGHVDAGPGRLHVVGHVDGVQLVS